MLSLLEELVSEYATEQESHQALGLSDRAQGFLSVAKTQASLSEDEAVELARRLDDAVAAHANVDDWHERDDVRRDIRATAMRALLEDERTRGLVTPAFLDELMTVATMRPERA